MSGNLANEAQPERLEADAAGIARAAGLLRAGRLVAVPTETVYGLAARADSEAAVAAIFRAKGRPDFNPLIVHVASLAAARTLAELDERAEALAAAYWPGPLTMVLPARPAGTEGMSEQQLAELVNRDSMIGVSTARKP